MDSSPDLSLKLRRGSSDSRDTFYMDFAQGIDSDIEEVDNSGIKREPQQTPTPPPPASDAMDMSLPTSSILPPPPLPSMLQHQPLPTLSEHDDLPPSPPLQHHDSAEVDNDGGSIDLASPLVSPTTSVLEMIPPPPLLREEEQISPPAETEDEADEQNDGDMNIPLPPPLPDNLYYRPGIDGSSPPMTKSPSTSPSPPVTPPPCPQMICLDKIVSPPMSHVPPLTPSSESDQSQPGSPPPLPPHPDIPAANDEMISRSPTQTGSPPAGPEHVLPSTPPPEFMESDDMIAAAVAATLVTASPDLVKEVLEANGIEQQYAAEDIKSLNDDESTTITTPPTNGYSASSIVLPQGELEHDYGLNLADIPPPSGMDSQEYDNDVDVDVDYDMEVEDDNTREKTLTSEAPNDDVITDDHTTADTPAEEAEEAQLSTATHSSTGSPKKSSIGKIPSRTGSRVGSRSGSIRAGSVGSVAHSIASVASAAAAVAAGSAISSPQPSIKSIKSQQSIKSNYSSKKGSPTVAGRLKSPPQAESPISMRSIAGIGTPSPPRVCSPPLRHKEAEFMETTERKR